MSAGTTPRERSLEDVILHLRRDLADKSKPIDMVLHCPVCSLQHIDAPVVEIRGGEQCHDWDNPPHRSHLCHGCGHIWRPADVPTNGVQAIKTQGKADSPVAEAVDPKRAAILATLAAYEAPMLETDADGFICEMAFQYGAEMLNDDGSTYAFTQEQLLAYTKANRGPAHPSQTPELSKGEDFRSLLSEVSACFTRVDDLPDELLPRIDRALGVKP